MSFQAQHTYHTSHKILHHLLLEEYMLDYCVVSCLLAPHTLCSVPGSPTAYRLGLGSPTRLIRLGLVSEATVSGSVGVEGTLPKGENGSLAFAPAVSAVGSAVFF